MGVFVKVESILEGEEETYKIDFEYTPHKQVTGQRVSKAFNLVPFTVVSPRTTYCRISKLIYGEDGKYTKELLVESNATTVPEDTFDKMEGRIIAFVRALVKLVDEDDSEAKENIAVACETAFLTRVDGDVNKLEYALYNKYSTLEHLIKWETHIARLKHPVREKTVYIKPEA